MIGKASCATGSWAHLDEGGQGRSAPRPMLSTQSALGCRRLKSMVSARSRRRICQGRGPGADRALRLAAQGAELEHFLMVRPLWQLAQTCWDEPCAWHMCKCAWKVQMPIFMLQQAAFVKRGSKWSHWRPLCVPQVSNVRPGAEDRTAGEACVRGAGPSTVWRGHGRNQQDKVCSSISTRFARGRACDVLTGK